MFTSVRRKMGDSCSDTWVVRGGLKPPAVDSPWVICLVIGAMIVLSLCCLFYRASHLETPSISGTTNNSPWPEPKDKP